MRVSTEEQAESGLGLAAQRSAIEAECQRRGWTLAAVHNDALSGKTLKRPGLAAALQSVESGAASAFESTGVVYEPVTDLALTG
ncbi:MAG TPA: recombinase family protein [Acidimicrobiales bacterium]|nr:recombinase family protein [Acidimicrobiales bacterium]